MRDRWISRLTAACLLLSLVLAACGSAETDDPGSGTDGGTPTATEASPTSQASPAHIASPTRAASISLADLTTLDWQLVQIDGAQILDGSIVTLTFIPDNRNVINGYSDCHNYMADIDWDETTFRISESGPFAGLAQTERPCQHPADGPRHDRYFFTALGDVTTYQATNERLVLLSADGEPQLTFVPRPPVVIDPDLTGTTWYLTGPYWLPDTEITLTFDQATQSLSGNDGCNEYGAQLLAASDGRLVFGEVSTTEMACLTPEGVMEQADRYTDELSRATRYKVDGDQLQLMSDNFGGALLFMREGADAFDPALAAHRWGLIEANGEPAIPGTLVTLELSEGFVSGSDSCNEFSGSMPLANDGALNINFAGYARTDQGCGSPEILAQAELVIAVLEEATSYTLDGDRLTISDAAGNQLVFGPQPEVLLIGKTWNVPMLYTDLPDGGIQGDALIEGTELTLTFNEDGTLEGSAGCNAYEAEYTIEGESITVNVLLITAMHCPDPPGIMEQEMTFLDTLQALTTWEIGMNGLTLTTDDGRSLRELNVVLR
jgi:heat shock protein HslJ